VQVAKDNNSEIGQHPHKELSALAKTKHPNNGCQENRKIKPNDRRLKQNLSCYNSPRP